MAVPDETLTKALLEEADRLRIPLLGVASMDRFEDVPRVHHPRTIFPEALSVVVIGKPIPRGALRGVEEGTQFDIYRRFGRDWLVNRMLVWSTWSVAGFLEDRGWEAVSVLDLPPELPPTGVPVREGAVPPNAVVDVRDAAVRAGLAEIGLNGELLTPEFGPRQRFQAILTDAPLVPTPLREPSVCRGCGACVRACPLNAFDGGAETVEICGLRMNVARVNLDVCRRCANGASPNMYHPAGRPDRLAALCNRACVHSLESAGVLRAGVQAPFRRRPPWWRDRAGDVHVGEIGEGAQS